MSLNQKQKDMIVKLFNQGYYCSTSDKFAHDIKTVCYDKENQIGVYVIFDKDKTMMVEFRNEYDLMTEEPEFFVVTEMKE